MSAYPIQYECDYKEDRNRLTTFFRLFMCIPHFIVGYVLGIIAFFAVVITWFSIVFTGKYPDGLYNFNAGVLRFANRLNAYFNLATDDFPSFGMGDDPDYPVRAKIAGPLPEYNRLKAGLRLIFGIPVYIIMYALQIIGGLAAMVSWFFIVITGKQNESLQSGINLSLSYSAKAYGYFMLLTEDWPPISASDDDTTATLPVGSPPASAPVGSTPESAAPGSTTSGGDPLGS
jgi:hypothetical protein